MYKQIKCPICGKESKVLGKARIMPFLPAKIYGLANRIDTQFRKCNNCDFYFFEARLDPLESSHLYSGYMNEDYKSLRRRFEWWFDKTLKTRKDLAEHYNNNLSRLVKFDKLITPFKNEINSVLDYGAGDCWHVLGTEKIFDVYDIDGIKCKLRAYYDLIVVSHVLEHLSEPIPDMKRFNFKYLYIEVPLHKPLMISLFKKRSLKQLLVDIYKIIRYRSWFQMHEHINFFSAKSIVKLYEKLDCSVVYFKQTENCIIAVGKRR